MKKLIAKWNCLLVAALMLASCGGEDEIETPEPVAPEPAQTEGTITITTPQVTDVTTTTATVRAQITTTGSVSITARGFCYATQENPTTDGSKVTASINDMMATLSRLDSKTTYYVRGYAETATGTTYSETATFTTADEPEPTLDGYVAPAYADDYRNNAGWDKRASWNLANVHDPTVFLADDGYYYMYQTDASFGNAHEGHGHFHGRRSKDLVNWEYLGGTMTAVPGWVKDSLNAKRQRLGLTAISSPSYLYWAPCARKVRSGLYRMYYCIGIDNYIKTGKANTTANFDNSWTEHAFIGVMETADPASNNWVDKGFVICSSSDKGRNWSRSSQNNWEAYFKFNAIDPSFIITPEGEHWLVYGSWHSGLAAVQLNAETGKTLAALPESWGTATSIAPYGKVVNTRGGRWQGSEGPEVVYHDGYYYLFMAYDGLDVPYNTRVVRSKNVNGPYVGKDGVNVTNGGQAFPIITHPYKFGTDHGWVGISHCAIFDDGKGNWYYASQARFPTTYDNWAPNAIMLGHVRSIRWADDGWPVVMPERYGAVPKVAVTDDDLVGDWENVSLTYDYGKQAGSVSLKLGSDHKVSGALFNGMNWSFDAEKNVITIGTQKLYVQRECDWEASPRHATIVYAGYSADGKRTFWGKKK